MIPRYGSAGSEHPAPAAAIGQAVGDVLEQIGEAPSVAVLFVSGSHVDALDDIADTVRRVLEPAVLLGATAVSVVSGPCEIEAAPAVSLWAGHLGDAVPTRLEVLGTADGTAVVGMPDEAAEPDRTLILLAEPRTFPADALVAASRTQYPDLRIVAAWRPATGHLRNRLVLDDRIHTSGAVGVLLPAGVGRTCVVSQGCRPIGDPFIVTASDANVVRELGGRPAYERLAELVESANNEERELLGTGLHVGMVIDESKLQFDRGDFLIRGVMGADRSTGSLAVGALAPVGSTLQFHVRDAASADDDLREMLGPRTGAGALLFTCSGRGEHLFGQPHHDASLVHETIRGGALAGMFCAGEFGPIAGESYVHGYTASILLFDE